MFDVKCEVEGLAPRITRHAVGTASEEDFLALVLAGTLVPPGPRSGGSERGSRAGGPLAQLGSWSSIGAFLLLCPMPMSGPDTSASSKLKIGSKAIEATESHQNGKHLLGPSLGGVRP